METFPLWQPSIWPNYDLFWYDILAIINFFFVKSILLMEMLYFVNMHDTILKIKTTTTTTV